MLMDCLPKIQIFKDAKLIKKVDDLIRDTKDINVKGRTEYGSGGMNTKIEAAKICNLAGCNMIIANGLHLSPISQIEKNDKCTLFASKTTKLQARKMDPELYLTKGELKIDEGKKSY